MASLVEKYVTAGRGTRLKELPRWRAWVMAARPRTLPAAAAPVILGTGMAMGDGGFRLGPALAALLGSFLIQIGTNIANDYYDHRRGGDNQDRVGPLRVTQAGIFSPATVRNVAFLVLALALLPGLYLVQVGGVPVLVIGLASLVCAIVYTGGPFPLAYHGLGDLFAFVFFGLVAVGGTYWVQALSFGPGVILGGAGIGSMITGILVVNNLRDLDTDERAGKRTMAVRLGHAGTKGEFAFLLGVALAVPLVGVVGLGWSPWTLLTLAVGLPLRAPLRAVWAHTPEANPARLIPALEGTARASGLYGVLLGVTLALT